MTVLITSLLLAGQQVETVQNPAPKSAPSAEVALAVLARSTGMVIYAPDESPQGYTLKGVETGRALSSTHFEGLNDRTAVRLKYWNAKTHHAIEFFQVAGSGVSDARFHTKWLGYSRVFEMRVERGDTFVARKIGAYDVALHSTLISDASAMEVLKRMRPIEP